MHGRWVVRDREGLVGGLFTDRSAAVHFALEQSNRVPGAVSCAPDEVIVSLGPTFETAGPQTRKRRDLFAA